jgi:hypothetical protein
MHIRRTAQPSAMCSALYARANKTEMLSVDEKQRSRRFLFSRRFDLHGCAQLVRPTVTFGLRAMLFAA